MNKTESEQKTVSKNLLSRNASVVDNMTLRASLIVASFIYSIGFSCVRNPMHRDNTLSWIGFDHPYGFLVWGILTSATFFINIAYVYRRHNYNGKLGNFALHAAPVFVLTTVFFNDWGWESVIHFTSSMSFIALNGFAAFFLFIHNYKKHINYRIMTFALSAVVLGMFFVYIVLDLKSGIAELAPFLAGLTILAVISLTDFLPVYGETESVPEPSRLKSKAEHLAGTAGIFGAHDFYMGKTFRGLAHLLLTLFGVLLCLDSYIGFGMINSHAHDGMRPFFDVAAAHSAELFRAHINEIKVCVEMMFMGRETSQMFFFAGLACIAASLVWAISDKKQINSGEINTDGYGNPFLN